MMFIAGQHIEFILPDDVRRNYSIASKPSVDGVTMIEVHIRHVPGGLFSDHMLSKIKERELMKFEGPLGSFCLQRESQKPIIMVASGTGFAPLRAMIENAFDLKVDQARSITLYWGGRARRDLYRADLPEAWAAEHPNFRFVPVLSEPTPDCNWTGRTGLVHEAVLADLPDLSGHEVYACGAPVMVDAARRDFTARGGLPEDAFFADAFLTRADTLTGA
jgi:CDP-4-dehydro-6-deoxyglucose reductase